MSRCTTTNLHVGYRRATRAGKTHAIAPDIHKVAVLAYELASADAAATDAVIAYPKKQ